MTNITLTHNGFDVSISKRTGKYKWTAIVSPMGNKSITGIVDYTGLDSFSRVSGFISPTLECRIPKNLAMKIEDAQMLILARIDKGEFGRIALTPEQVEAANQAMFARCETGRLAYDADDVARRARNDARWEAEKVSLKSKFGDAVSFDNGSVSISLGNLMDERK